MAKVHCAYSSDHGDIFHNGALIATVGPVGGIAWRSRGPLYPQPPTTVARGLVKRLCAGDVALTKSKAARQACRRDRARMARQPKIVKGR